MADRWQAIFFVDRVLQKGGAEDLPGVPGGGEVAGYTGRAGLQRGVWSVLRTCSAMLPWEGLPPLMEQIAERAGLIRSHNLSVALYTFHIVVTKLQ